MVKIQSTENPPAEATSEAPAGQGSIPPETWALIQKAGHRAAEALSDLLDPKSLEKLKPGDKLRALELAFARAYGPPIKREVSVTLSGDVSDAVSASLAGLAARDLPEMGRSGDVLDAEPGESGFETHDSPKPLRRSSTPLSASERQRRRAHGRYASDA